MAQIIAGETDKMGVLYERYKRPLYAYFFKLTGGDNQASEDLLHTVFYRVIKYKTSFTGKGSFPNWVFRIARNAGIDHNRKIKHKNIYKAEVLSSQAVMYEDSDLEREERSSLLENAMSRLNRDERELLILGKIECLKYKEIADILNTTESNVKIRVFRALKKLRDIYLKLEKRKYEKERS